MTDPTALLSTEEIFSGLSVPAGSGRMVVAYSGGLDSHALLHLLHDYANSPGRTIKLLAVHVNHKLNPQAGAWAEHCRGICARLNVEFALVEIDARAPKGESQEAWARKLRYEALQQYIGPDDVLLTAHHRDDMAETLLIQMLRGAGPAGLAAMPIKGRFGAGWHCRPLLSFSRSDLDAYAKQHSLSWIEDDSNADMRYDRNLLRNSVLPTLKQRWPALSTTLYRAARLQAEAALLLEELAAIDVQTCVLNEGRGLHTVSLQALSRARAANVLRYWLRQRGHPVPSERQMDEIFLSVLAAGPEAAPCLAWAGTELRRYRDCLFVDNPLPEPPDPAREIGWDLNTSCQLALGELHAYRSRGEGIRVNGCIGGRLSVQFRRADARIRIAGHHHELRKLFQQYGVASCYRDYVPLLYSGDTLVTIPGLAIADGWRAANEDGWKIEWTALSMVRPGTGTGAER